MSKIIYAFSLKYSRIDFFYSCANFLVLYFPLKDSIFYTTRNVTFRSCLNCKIVKESIYFMYKCLMYLCGSGISSGKALDYGLDGLGSIPGVG